MRARLIMLLVVVGMFLGLGHAGLHITTHWLEAEKRERALRERRAKATPERPPDQRRCWVGGVVEWLEPLECLARGGSTRPPLRPQAPEPEAKPPERETVPARVRKASSDAPLSAEGAVADGERGFADGARGFRSAEGSVRAASGGVIDPSGGVR